MTVPPFPPLIASSRASGLRAVYGTAFFGYSSYLSASLPDRLYTGLDEARRPAALIDEPAIDAEVLPTAVDLLAAPATSSDSGWPTATRQTLARLESLWLLTEDRQRLLDAQAIDPLPHQAALVEHVLSTAGLERVLIADEVGLGKTVEVGLIIQRLQRSNAALRVLYLTEARLVPNVVEELERVGLSPRPRLWTAEHPEARLKPNDSDPMVVASIHKAVANADTFVAAGPWDVVVVDEAHHLTDYSEDGGDPRERMRLVRRLVRERLIPSGRLLLLSGTPHQGHLDRFKNLLRLLSHRDDERDAAGKVIYRIKDDIVGWDGEPLFPLREVRAHRVVSVDGSYNEWMSDVHELLAPGPTASRASAWRRAQALQWCASSPEAGLAYLARLALRSGSRSTSNRALRRALEGLRPYREGRVDERLDALEARLLAGTRELDEDPEVVFSGGTGLLDRVLDRGAELVEGDAFSGKLRSLIELFEEAPDEKFVVFAQPIETVYTLRRRLEQEYGAGSVSLIVGGQTVEERKSQIREFVGNRAVRVMVSSRSGGEGINLQVARRLVHFDVPWNPMEMEQRVGRVHRYGGVRTIVVDTLVLEGSRESRVLSRARARLAAIVKDLDRSRFELLFSRTMALVPLEELAALMAGEQFAPLDDTEEERLDSLVKSGLVLLRESEQEFRSRAAALRQIEPGEATHEDLESWLLRHGKARALEGFQRRALVEDSAGGGRSSRTTSTQLLALDDGRRVFVAPEGGVGVEDEQGQSVEAHRVGLNDNAIAERVRTVVAEADREIGAGTVLIKRKVWESWSSEHGVEIDGRGGILMVYLIRRIEPSASPPERSVTMHAWLVSPDVRSECRLSGAALAAIVRVLREPRPKQRPTVAAPPEALREAAARHLEDARSTKPGDAVAAVFPVAAVQVEVD